MHAPRDTSMVDRPFAAPLEATLYLPPPPSVNKTRKVDWKARRRVKQWVDAADAAILSNGGLRHLSKMPDKFEVIIVLDENLNRLDCDNAIKALIDYCRRIELIIDDDKKHMRKVTVLWGHAPSGCRLTLRSVL